MGSLYDQSRMRWVEVVALKGEIRYTHYVLADESERYRPAEGRCEHSNKHSSAINGELFEWLSNY
jgi:hypothetical protein